MMIKKILLVDDEDIIRLTLQQDLQDEGYEVETAADGKTAVTMLDKGYDLIITDLMMEGMDGIALLETARKNDPHQAVFILTGYGELNSAINALRLGAADYLLKPYKYEELLLRIENCVDRHELRRKVELYEDILPICCDCKKIRDDEKCEFGKGEWITPEEYFYRKTDLKLSHSYCPECKERCLRQIEEMGR